MESALQNTHVTIVNGEDNLEVAEQGGVCDLRSSDPGYRTGGDHHEEKDEEEEGDKRCCSSSSDSILREIVKERRSSVSDCCSVVVDLDNAVPEVKLHSVIVKRDCRICQMSFDASNQESGLPIELGCSCKNDLAAAHKQCAESWFKIKGDRTCEICGSTAHNVAGWTESELIEPWNDANDAAAAAEAEAAAAISIVSLHAVETRSFWQGHRFLNFLLACMVFAFVISWLFHFNVPS